MIQYHSLSGFASYCESGAINGYHQYENGPKLSISRVLNIEACFSSLNISFLTTFFKVFFTFGGVVGDGKKKHNIFDFSRGLGWAMYRLGWASLSLFQYFGFMESI